MVTGSEFSIPLAREFRFVHEPGGSARQSAAAVVGRADDLSEFVARIVYSDGGALLLAGYRGVGKTTFVNEVVRGVRRRLQRPGANSEPVELVDVYLSFARPMSATELMHHVLRGLCQRLREMGLLGRLDGDLRQELELAFLRTSVGIGIKSLEESERTLNLDANLALPLLGIKPAWGIGMKRARSSARELSYLAYDDKAAESDLVRLGRRLIEGYASGTRIGRSLRRFFRRPAPRVRLKILFTFDELDKLELGAAGGASPLDEILRSLKTLLTTSGLHFLFVAGRELYDRWLADVGHGDSIYESVFAHVHYLPALWAHVDGLCDPLVDCEGLKRQAEQHRIAYQDFKRFLAFKGRGIPRRILRGFNEVVCVRDDTIRLRITPEDRRRFQLYSGLYDLLEREEERVFGERAGELEFELLDRRRLGLYYVVDSILARGAAAFTAQDVVEEARRLSHSIALAEDVAPLVVGALLAILEEQGYVERVGRDTLLRQPDGQEIVPVWYRVPRSRLIELGRLRGFFEREAEAIRREDTPAALSDRYEILEEVGRGGTAVVFKALDRTTGLFVALKLLHPQLVDSAFRERFSREVAILRRLRHPSVVSLVDAQVEGDRPYLVMDYIDGLALSQLREPERALPWPAVVAIARQLFEALAYVHEQGVYWRDAKPANVFVTEAGRVVIVDFGIAKPSDTKEITATGTILGTAGYVSPEQLRGERADARSDLFSVGVILYELATGRAPFASESVVDMIYRVITASVPPPSELADVPAALEKVILRCLEKVASERYPTARQALAELPPEDSEVFNIQELVRAAATRLAIDRRREEVHTMLGDLSFVGRPEPTSAIVRASSAPMSSLETERSAPSPVTWIGLGHEEAVEEATASEPPQPAAPQPASRTSDVTRDLAPFVAPSPFVGPVLVLETADGVRVLPLTGAEMTVGRSSASDIVLDDASVSRYHARLRAVPGGYSIEDQNSSNGVQVNGGIARESIFLADGDQIYVGSVRLAYWNAGAETAPPVA